MLVSKPARRRVATRLGQDQSSRREAVTRAEHDDRPRSGRKEQSRGMVAFPSDLRLENEKCGKVTSTIPAPDRAGGHPSWPQPCAGRTGADCRVRQKPHPFLTPHRPTKLVGRFFWT
jgi:hypothetical protein